MEDNVNEAHVLGTSIAGGRLCRASNAGMAQTDLTMLGGATGATVYCIQAGDLTNGLFVGTYYQTGVGAWEEHLKGGAFKFQETKREELAVEIWTAHARCRCNSIL